MTLSCLPGEGINLLLMKLQPSYTKTIRTVSKWKSDVYTSICQGVPYRWTGNAGHVPPWAVPLRQAR
jgi:hypothetical protein